MSFDAWDFQCSGTRPRLFLGLLSVTYQEAEHLQHQFESATSPKHNHKLSFSCRYMVKSVMHVSKAISSAISPLNGMCLRAICCPRKSPFPFLFSKRKHISSFLNLYVCSCSSSVSYILHINTKIYNYFRIN